MPRVVLPPNTPRGPIVVWPDVNSIVVVGANGSGKSLFGFWMEQNIQALGYRIAAQKALVIPENIPAGGQAAAGQLSARKQSANQPMSDFTALLNALFSDERERNRKYSRSAREKLPAVVAPNCKFDLLEKIWASVFPHRVLVIENDKVEARRENGKPYAAQAMSDGERVAFYHIGKCLFAPSDAVIIIDEPEIHLHQAIQIPLWNAIEAARTDCTFVYLTHDLGFAESRVFAKKIWLKSYQENNWEWEEIQSNPAVPDALLYQVLGSRRNVLFVEGDETNSYDTPLYSALYPNELVLSRQNCDKVVEATKAMSALPGLHNLKVRGIVDRDRRGDKEIASLKANGILVADVAEVENLLCLPEALVAVLKLLKNPNIDIVKETAQAKVLAELENHINQQALSHALADIQFRLNGFGPKIGNIDSVKLETELHDYVSEINVGKTVATFRTLFEDIVNKKDYKAALRHYNCKGILAFVGDIFGVKKDVYSQMVLGIVKESPNGDVGKAMRKAIEE